MKIYGYYESLQLCPQAEQFARANVWKQSWERHGWECVMLNNSHAKGSPLFQKLVAKLLRTMCDLSPEAQTTFQKTLTRFTRLAALHAAHGGWLSDYDVVNTGFAPADAHTIERPLLVIDDCLFHLTPEMAQASLQRILSEDVLNDLKRVRPVWQILNQEQGSLDGTNLIHVTGEKRSERMAELL